jgi:hypothetical protein
MIRQGQDLNERSPQTAFSSESGRTYQLNKLIGKGGFGEVYRYADASGRSPRADLHQD